MVIGLTGNYGMGKSFVLSVYRELGAFVLDSDDIVNNLLQDKKVIQRVKKIFGDCVEREDGGLDKSKIAHIVFNNRMLREQLEALLHPMVIDRVDVALQKIKGEKRIVIVEVPLLFECGYQNRFDRTITVFTTQKEALERLGKAGVSRSDAMKRLEVQLPIRIKKKMADYLVDNNGTEQETRKQVGSMYKKLLREMV